MSDNKELVPTGYNAVLPSENQLRSMANLAQSFFRSGLIPKSIRNVNAAFVVLQCGAELGLKPMQSFRYVNVIQGKPSVAPELMWSRIMSVKGRKIDIESNEKFCRIKASRPGVSETTIEWSIDQAKNANLLGKDSWRNYPRAMLRARCIAEIARAVFPDVIEGASYIPEELGAEVDEQGEVKEVQSVAEPTQSKQSPPVQSKVHAQAHSNPRPKESHLEVTRDDFDEFNEALAANPTWTPDDAKEFMQEKYRVKQFSQLSRVQAIELISCVKEKGPSKDLSSNEGMTSFKEDQQANQIDLSEANEPGPDEMPMPESESPVPPDLANRWQDTKKQITDNPDPVMK